MKAFALIIPYIGLKIKTRTSTIIKAKTLAMHGPLEKIAGVERIEDSNNNDNKLNSQNT